MAESGSLNSFNETIAVNEMQIAEDDATHASTVMWFILSAGPAFDSSGQKTFYAKNSPFARPQADRCAASPCHGRLRAESANMLSAARNPFGGHMDNVVNIRDFKRKEEREAADVRLAKQVMGLDTAPSEMPPVQPMYVAPESDPA
jgi:hypothetical protein